MTTVQYVLKYIVQMMFVALYQMRKRTSLDHPYSVWTKNHNIYFVVEIGGLIHQRVTKLC